MLDKLAAARERRLRRLGSQCEAAAHADASRPLAGEEPPSGSAHSRGVVHSMSTSRCDDAVGLELNLTCGVMLAACSWYSRESAPLTCPPQSCEAAALAGGAHAFGAGPGTGPKS
jgi:hypothetical protein